MRIGRKIDLLPWDVTDKHPVTILVFIGWDIIRIVQKIHQLTLIHEILHSLRFTVALRKHTINQ